MNQVKIKNKILKLKGESFLFEKVQEIVNCWDPVDLLPMAPNDEYTVEIKRIIEFMSKNPHLTIFELSYELRQIFIDSFGKELIFKSNEEEIAQKLVNLMNKDI